MSCIDHYVAYKTCQFVRITVPPLAVSGDWEQIKAFARHHGARMPHRPDHIVQDRLELRAIELIEEANGLPHGGEKDALLHRIRAMNGAWRVIDGWASSPGLRAPK
jgi:hypothetical protein